MEYLVHIWTYIGDHVKTQQITSITAVVSLLTVFISICATLFTIKKNRRTSREKNTLDFEVYCQNDEEYIKHTKVLFLSVFPKMVGENGNINKEKCEATVREYIKYSKARREDKLKENYPNKSIRKKMKAEFTAIIFIMNVWERTANAVRHKIYDEKYIYSSQCSTLMQYYSYLEEFIKQRRVQDNHIRLCVNMEWLAVKWKVQHAIHGKQPERLLRSIELVNKAKHNVDYHNNVKRIPFKLRVNMLYFHYYRKIKF